MFELILLTLSSICIIILVNQNLKLQRKIVDYEFDKFMGQIDRELTSSTREDYTIVERILQ